MAKNSEDVNKLTAEITENLFDNVVLSTTTSIFEEVVKAFPITNAFQTVFNSYRNLQEKRRAIQFIKFVEECERHQAGQILKVYKSKSNLEMGMEIMNAIEDSYLEIHAQMIARVAILYDVKQIDRSNFLKYAHIIPKLSSYLLEQIEDTYKKHIYRVKNPNNGFQHNEILEVSHELQNYGFIVITPGLSGGHSVKGTDELKFFYENIYKNKHDKKD